eukprot:TRINITY_DN13565_c0_g1_i2.p1 TRINITY_DN13565_c0_g1~~TRINITY_DN13565_c0_g1_i2.p1  ORF type:complete len:155 (+),score=6.87 TRINITY_DN13565_c0_g1_i2:113-577(+)
MCVLDLGEEGETCIETCGSDCDAEAQNGISDENSLRDLSGAHCSQGFRQAGHYSGHVAPYWISGTCYWATGGSSCDGKSSINARPSVFVFHIDSDACVQDLLFASTRFRARLQRAESVMEMNAFRVPSPSCFHRYRNRADRVIIAAVLVCTGCA